MSKGNQISFWQIWFLFIWSTYCRRTKWNCWLFVWIVHRWMIPNKTQQLTARIGKRKHYTNNFNLKEFLSFQDGLKNKSSQVNVYLERKGKMSLEISNDSTLQMWCIIHMYSVIQWHKGAQYVPFILLLQIVAIYHQMNWWTLNLLLRKSWQIAFTAGIYKYYISHFNIDTSVRGLNVHICHWRVISCPYLYNFYHITNWRQPQ